MRNEEKFADAALTAAEKHEQKAYAQVKRLLNTSVEDASASLQIDAERDPGIALCDSAAVLTIMNADGTAKKAHRQALAKAARKALNKLAEVPA